MRLSEHFTLAEAEASMTATRLGIDNTVPVVFYPRLRHVAETALEPIRQHYGIPFAPSSWYRCLPLNRALRSKDTSYHLKALAVDVELPGVANDDLFNWCKLNLRFDQLIREFPKKSQPASGWVHIGVAEPGQIGRMQRFSVPADPRYTR